MRRKRRDSGSTPPSAFILGQEPTSPLAGSSVITRVTSNTPHIPSSPSSISHERPKIKFYNKHEPHYGFTNFSSHPVTYNKKIYPTSEHLFQSFKFTHRPNLAEHIRTCSFRPSTAFSEARRFAPEVREDWSRDNIRAMDIVLLHKFTQHKDLRRELLSTRNAELIENSDKDAFWGCGADGKGKNELGKALERLRDQLRKEKRW